MWSQILFVFCHLFHTQNGIFFCWVGVCAFLPCNIRNAQRCCFVWKVSAQFTLSFARKMPRHWLEPQLNEHAEKCNLNKICSGRLSLVTLDECSAPLPEVPQGHVLHSWCRNMVFFESKRCKKKLIWGNQSYKFRLSFSFVHLKIWFLRPK